PRVVTAFGRVVNELRGEVEKEELQAPRLGGGLPVQRGEGIRTLGTSVNDGSKASVFDDIALAHREIYALYQIAQTMGTSLGVSDTMALISSKLANLVPFSTCALFLYSD